MSGVNLVLVKKLREELGVGFADCVKALKEANENYEEARVILRKKGIASSEKKASRIANEGAVSFLQKDDLLIVVEMRCETDFVARGDNFKFIIDMTLDQLLSKKPKDLDELMNSSYENSNFKETFDLKKMAIGENIKIGSFKIIDIKNKSFGFYLHNPLNGSNNAGQILSIVLIDRKTENQDILNFLKQIGMHIVASQPIALYEKDIDPILLEFEKSIFLSQAENSGKPQNVIQKMIDGRLKKFIQEKTLTKQQFVCNTDVTVETAILNVQKDFHFEFNLDSFFRFQLSSEAN